MADVSLFPSSLFSRVNNFLVLGRGGPLGLALALGPKYFALFHNFLETFDVEVLLELFNLLLIFWALLKLTALHDLVDLFVGQH